MISYLLPKVLPEFEHWLFVGGTVLEAVLLLRLWHLGLLSRYRALTAILLVEFLRALVLMNLTYGRDAYSIFFVATHPLILAAYGWVAFESYRLVLESYQGISVLSRRALGICLLASATVAVAFSAANMKFENERSIILLLFSALTESVTLTLLVFLLLLYTFMLWYPIPLRRNLVLYVMVFGLYFLAFGFGMFLRTSGGSEKVNIVSQLTMSIEALCLLLWIGGFRKQGETVSVAVGNLLHSEEAPRLLAQLDNLNSILLHTDKQRN